VDFGTPNPHGTSQPKSYGLRELNPKTNATKLYFYLVFKQSFEDLPTGEVIMNFAFVFGFNLLTCKLCASVYKSVTVLGIEVMMKHKALDRAGRKATIIQVFKIRLQHDNRSPATSYEVAKLLGLSASDKLRKILNEMVEDGTLKCVEHIKKGRMKGSGYMLAEDSENAPRKKTIAIKSKGALVGQLEMF
jgi:hypothetical protein